MWYFLLVVCFADKIMADEYASSNYYCAHNGPQQHILINQLRGMWYGVEIIKHQEERHYVKKIASCPIIHISEDQPPMTTQSPLHRGVSYGSRYGPGYTQNPYPSYQVTHHETNRDWQARIEYDRRTTYSNHPKSDFEKNYGQTFLRLFWDENGDTTVYHLKVNLSEPGLWSSSAPNAEGTNPAFRNFAGFIQVLKVVGNHMVLNFCHRAENPQFFTVVLSREPTLDLMEIHGVHSFLHNKGLSTNAIEKVCNNGSSRISLSEMLFIFMCLLISFLRRTDC